jgi:hypothetical protein
MTAVLNQLPAPADLEGFATHYGVPITFIGDDGDRVIALGHHQPRRALAALNRYTRIDLGWTLANEQHSSAAELLAGFEHRWATIKTHCDRHPGCGGTALVTEPGGFKYPACYDCLNIAASDWWLDWSDSNSADTPGAFPVTFLEI